MIKDLITKLYNNITNNKFLSGRNNEEFTVKSVYSDFAPYDNLDENEESIKALDWAIKNPRITNIAITGPYGSGKSSVISSYCGLHPECKYTKISLATFDGSVWDKLHELHTQHTGEDSKDKKDGNDNFKADVRELEDELERGILKQLFYKVDGERIPLSRYRKLHVIKLKKYIIGVSASFVILGTMAYIIVPEKILLLKTYYSDILASIFSKFTFFGFFLLALLGISYAVRYIMTKFVVKQISVGDASIQRDTNISESILNKNMDEMLYFFECTGLNIVFIEDLDRFKTNSIFIKLREINVILNQYEGLTDKVVFVYAVKDDLFNNNTDRTKFFDFIIPVIPVINSTNSGEIMRNLLGLGDEKDNRREYPDHNISSRFITLVSPYIGDMRVLISIINEFWMYKNTVIKGSKDLLSDECLLALIIYKNLYPRDFALLEAEDGDVKSAFNYKKMAIKKAQEHLISKKSQMECVLSDVLISIKEIKIIILSEIINNNGFVTKINVSGTSYSYSQILSDKFSLDEIRNKELRVYCKRDNYPYEQELPNSINLEKNETLKKLLIRYDAQCALNEQQQEEILAHLDELENDFVLLSDSTLQRLIEKYPIEKVLPENVRNNDLLVFLLRHGYINENYADYINYFHSGSISKEELNFILSVRNHKSLEDFSFNIKHCGEVIDRLDDFEFEQIEVLNFDLFDFLLNSNVNENKLQRFIKQIVNRSSASRSFIKAYIERNKNIEKFIQEICHKSGHVWEDIEKDELIPIETKDKYFYIIIKYCDIDDINNNNYKNNGMEYGGIRNYIESDKKILHKLSDIPILKLQSLIKTLDIHFYEVNMTGIDDFSIDFILKGRFYLLCPAMLEEIFKIKKTESIEYLSHANYHCLRELGDVDLLGYVYDNFVEYINKFVLGVESNIEEEKEDIDEILDRLFEESSELCIEVIKKEQKAYWIEISNCLENYEDNDKKEVWDYLLLNSRTDKSWINYNIYRNVFGLTPELLEFVNINMHDLINDESKNILDDEIINELMVANLSAHSFILLISAYKVENFTNSFTEFDENKLRILIDNKYFDFTVDRYIKLKDISYKLCVQFASKNKIEFLKVITECDISIDEVKEYLGYRNFEQNEISAILECVSVADVDRELALKISKKEFKIPKKYVNAAWDILENEEKKQLLINQINIYSMDELAKKLGELEYPYKRFSERQRRKYTLSDDIAGLNFQLCKKLCVRGFLSSCKMVENNESKSEKQIEVYVRQKPKQTLVTTVKK